MQLINWRPKISVNVFLVNITDKVKRELVSRDADDAVTLFYLFLFIFIYNKLSTIYKQY